MGHRALVAYEQAPGEYDVHYSHNGAIKLRLVHQISEETPYADGGVDAEPHDDDRRGVSLETIKDELLDYGRHEALFIVDADFEVTAWGVEEYSFGRYYGNNYRQPQGRQQQKAETPPDTEPRARGVCLPVRWYDGEPVSLSLDRGRVKGYVESAAELMEAEYFDDVNAAVDWIHQKVRSRYRGPGSPNYDDPMISSEDNVPLELRADTTSVSDLMTDGGQQQLGDY